MKKQLLLYGLILGLFIFLLKWLEYRLIIYSHAVEIYGGILALLFTIIGIWAGQKITARKKEIVFVEKLVTVNVEKVVTVNVEKLVTVIVPQPMPVEINLAEIEKRGISSRELEVLQLVADGLSNQQIADKLFVSLNTVKTHTSNLFLKLEVARRTQAIQKAKELRIIS